ncbi:signal transduction protein [Calothrix sp. NIES-4071]|nr:signal transduction protein [Calothrix sp. NIES-4071]BAZ62741.1 signal transduction protein [Calothrix sp. NIES-4105]
MALHRCLSSFTRQWNLIADTYRDSGKYEQAVEYQLQCLTQRQKLGSQSDVASSFYKLGRIYQAWGKYEQAISYYQQSRNLYEQLDREQSVANQCGWISDCYHDWGKYEQAIECLQNYLQTYQNSDNNLNTALAYLRLGRIYQAWGKYEQAISYYQQSRGIYEQLDKKQDVASLWGWMSNCYRDWGKYKQAIEYRQNYLQMNQRLDNQPIVAGAYSGIGQICQEWDKYEQAISYYQQSNELYKELGREQDLANQLSRVANCYLNLKDYNKAIDYYQQSCDLHSLLGDNKSVAIRCRRLAYTQSLLARNLEDTTQAFDLLAQAEQNIHQAMQINTAGAYTENLAYDYIALSLLISERLRLSPNNGLSPQEQIAQFEQNYNIGLCYFDELGQTVDKAEEVLDIARAYLEVGALENLEFAEELAQESLHVFQEFNRRKLEASAYKLLGEIYLKRRERKNSNAEAIATQFLTESLQIYHALDLQEKAIEVEKLL